jgi:hypothetical protein
MTTDVFNAALAVAKRVGYRNITRQLVGQELGKSDIWLNNHHPKWREAVVEISERAAELGVQPGQRQKDTSGLWRDQDKAAITLKGYELARQGGFASLSRSKVARAAGFSPGTISNYFGSSAGLLEAIMQHAIDQNDSAIVMQGLAVGSAVARSAPDKLKKAAAKCLDPTVKAE